MRILAIDHGTKRMGLAISDELGIIAQPLGYLPAEPLSKFFNQLEMILRQREVGRIVVGMPRNMDGSYGPAAQKVQAFIAALEQRVNLPVKTLDERLTSAQANRVLLGANMRRGERKQKVDQLAAAILLQGYLDATSGT